MKQCKVIMLPTKSGNIMKYADGILQYQPALHHQWDTTIPQHLYLISNDKIEDGDWVYCLGFIGSPIIGDEKNFGGEFIPSKWIAQVKKFGNGPLIANDGDTSYDVSRYGCFKKIIATTDSSLKLHCVHCENSRIHISDGKGQVTNCSWCKSIPQISQSFVQAFVKVQGKIDEVMVEAGNYCENCGQHNCDNLACRGFKNIFSIKTRPDNTVIIHLIKKNYTKEDFDEILHKVKIARGTLGNGDLNIEPETIWQVRTILDSIIDSINNKSNTYLNDIPGNF